MLGQFEIAVIKCYTHWINYIPRFNLAKGAV